MRRRSVITATTRTPEVFAIKSTSPPVPFWHMADDEYQSKIRSKKRSRNEDAFDFQKRASVPSSSREGVGAADQTANPINNRPRVYLGPNMEIRTFDEPDEPDDVDMEEDEPPPPVVKPPM